MSRFAMKPPWDAILWWEVRRIPFNFLVGMTGLIGIALVFWIGDARVPVGEDAIEPMLLFFGVPVYAVAANLCYTLGWASEVWGWGDTVETVHRREGLFRLGLAFSIGVTALPFAVLLALWTAFGIP